MGEEPAKKPDWVIPFLRTLSLIGWGCAIFYETFYFVKVIRDACLLFGVWACVIAIVNGLYLFLTRGRAIILVIVMLTVPPGFYFGVVLRNIAIEKGFLNSNETQSEKVSEPNQLPSSEDPLKPTVEAASDSINR